MDKVFAQRDVDTMHHKEVISENKKLDKGDSGWSQWKEILDWILDSKQRTLELMDWCSKWIMDIFEDFHGQNRVRVKKWQQVLGELQFMEPAVLGLAGLSGALQLGLSHMDKHRVKITCFRCDHLTDFEALAHDIHFNQCAWQRWCWTIHQ